MTKASERNPTGQKRVGQVQREHNSSRLAIVGAGVSGLVAAFLLAEHYDVTVYEAGDTLGGHIHTVEVEDDHGRHAIDVGFIVYNERNYPSFTRLLHHLDVKTQPSDMSFSVSRDGGYREWAGSGFLPFFGYGRHLTSPTQWSLLGEILRFNRRLNSLVHGTSQPPPLATLGAFLKNQHFSDTFLENYLLPMASAIWSVPMREILDFPTVAFASFFHNHGLLGLRGRPLWRTIQGGAARYVAALQEKTRARFLTGQSVTALIPDPHGWRIATKRGDDVYGRIVLACHADQAYRLLPSDHPLASILAGVRFQPNRLVFHRDVRLLPRQPRLWSSWNYFVTGQESRPAFVSYWMNRLQRLKTPIPYVVSLNPEWDPAPGTIIKELIFSHPVYDHPSQQARRRLADEQGHHGLYVCGAWTGYGFHEDGVRSALDVAVRLGAFPPWSRARP